MESKISVVINTYNAEQHLERVLETVKDFDEVLVCDMESTDNTVAIAQKHGCKVITFPKGTFNIVEPARDYAIKAASHDWVLVIDADELVTTQLREYLYQAINGDNCPEGICIPRKNYFMGRFLHSHYPDYVLRFFKRDKALWPATIHSTPVIDGRVERIPEKQTKLALVHLANDSVSDIIRKWNTYSDNELLRRQHERYGIGSVIFRPFYNFFKFYVLKGGFRDGMPGLVHATLESVYKIIIVAKMIERYYRKNNKPEKQS